MAITVTMTTLDNDNDKDDDDCVKYQQGQDQERKQKNDLFWMIVRHTGGVIHGQQDLVLSLAGFSSPQPDLVFPELTCDVWDYFPHVQPFSCSIITSDMQREQHSVNSSFLEKTVSLCSRPFARLLSLVRSFSFCAHDFIWGNNSGLWSDGKFKNIELVKQSEVQVDTEELVELFDSFWIVHLLFQIMIEYVSF